MFARSANYYDVIYETMGKNYEIESSRLLSFVKKYGSGSCKTLLDVACGTGEHLKYLQKDFSVEGLDLDQEILKIVAQKLPHIPVHHANMLDFTLARKYDVVACLFSSIGYAVTRENLFLAIRNMQKHMSAGGLLFVEPWLSPEQFFPGTVHAVFVNQPNLKIARMNVSEVIDSRISVLNFQYLVATPDGVQHFSERHELGLFTREEYLSAFRECGMKVLVDEEGLDGRGLYIGINPS